jgi:DNA processing protein
LHIARSALQMARQKQSGERFAPPLSINRVSLSELLRETNRGEIEEARLDLLRRNAGDGDVQVYYAGDRALLCGPCVSVVGTREVSEEGHFRARRVARDLAQAGIVVVSGLAKGVDTAAHTAAMEYGGRTVAVLGTPLDKAYPAENSKLLERIWRDHLALSPFQIGQPVYKGNFPARNRVMAAVTDATVIIEASDTSGTLHQAAECQRLGRWLFIAQSVAEDPRLKWPANFLSHPKSVVLSSAQQIVERITK